MIIVDTVDDFHKFVFAAKRADILFLDTETTGLDPYSARLLIISARFDNKTYVLDFTKLSIKLLYHLRNALRTKLCVFHNATYDWKIFFHNGVELKNCYCTMVAEQVLTAGFKELKPGLGDVAHRRLGIILNKSIREEFIDSNQDILTQNQMKYAAQDVDVLEGIYQQQQQEMKDQQLEKVFDLEMKLLPITARMEYVGVPIDRKRLEAAAPVFRSAIEQAEQDLQDSVIFSGHASEIVFTRDGYYACNANSPIQMLEIAAKFGVDSKSLNKKELTEWDNRWSLKNNKKLESKAQSEDEEDDFEIGFNHPFLRKYAIVKALTTLYDRYVIGLLKKINPITGKLHTNFKQCGADSTGRFSSSNPNLQNLPKYDKLRALGLEAHDIRSMFLPNEGRMMIVCDYGAIESVILAAMAHDENMLDKLTQDFHSYVATQLFGIEVNKKLSDDKVEPHATLRQAAKTISYAIMFGTSGWNLWRTLGTDLAKVGVHVTQEIAEGWIVKWKALFPQVGKLLDQNSKYAITRYYVTTVTGRRRRWNRLFLNTKKAYMAAEREGCNAPIQGSSADMTKLAMLLVDSKLDKTRGELLLCVHDEIVVEADFNYVEEAKEIVRWAMEEAGRILFPALKEGLIKASPKESNCYNK